MHMRYFLPKTYYWRLKEVKKRFLFKSSGLLLKTLLLWNKIPKALKNIKC